MRIQNIWRHISPAASEYLTPNSLSQLLTIISLLLIPQSFDWLAVFHLELLQAILFIAV
jgi:hypothetical protein